MCQRGSEWTDEVWKYLSWDFVQLAQLEPVVQKHTLKDEKPADCIIFQGWFIVEQQEAINNLTERQDQSSNTNVNMDENERRAAHML